MQAEQGRHRGERGTDEDGAPVAPADADRREEDRRGRRRRRRDSDAREMEAAGEVDLGGAEKMSRRKRHGCQRAGKRERRYEPISHQTDIGRGW
jgi:hypothetical protein